MAKAPQPGRSRKEQAKKLGFRITVNGEAAEICLADITPRDDALVRRETKRDDALGAKTSLMGAVQQLADGESIGTDTLCVLWWFGRRKAGDTTESLAQALDRFPALVDLDEACDIEVIEDGEGEGDEPDPLPSGGD